MAWCWGPVRQTTTADKGNWPGETGAGHTATSCQVNGNQPAFKCWKIVSVSDHFTVPITAFTISCFTKEQESIVKVVLLKKSSWFSDGLLFWIFILFQQCQILLRFCSSWKLSFSSFHPCLSRKQIALEVDKRMATERELDSAVSLW